MASVLGWTAVAIGAGEIAIGAVLFSHWVRGKPRSLLMRLFVFFVYDPGALLAGRLVSFDGTRTSEQLEAFCRGK